MPDLLAAGRTWSVPAGSNLLDALNHAGLRVPYSCRAGSCHACMVRCTAGDVQDAMPDALNAAQRAEGWRLACQCRVASDLAVELFDPLRDGQPADVLACDWLSADVLRLRLQPHKPLRYSAGQHLVLWTDTGVARPYSLASVPGLDPWMEFHIDCHERGAFSDAARAFAPGMPLRLGELRGGALHYDADWNERPLWLLAAGTGLAPLWGILREALRQQHQGPIRLLHVARERAELYLAEPLRELVAEHPQVQVDLLDTTELTAVLAELKLVSRQTRALLCGSPASVERFARRLYLAGLPRNQLLADVFLPRA